MLAGSDGEGLRGRATSRELARRGQGRHPFAIEGGLVAVDCRCRRAGARRSSSRASSRASSILALVATGIGRGHHRLELAPRAGVGQPPLRRPHRGERRPRAHAGSLRPSPRQLGAPIKALLGVNLLRHIHVTFDRRGDQFVVREGRSAAAARREPRPALLRARRRDAPTRRTVTSKEDGARRSSSTARALFPARRSRTRVEARGRRRRSRFTPMPGAPNVKRGTHPAFRSSAGSISPKVPAIEGGAPRRDARRASTSISAASSARAYSTCSA